MDELMKILEALTEALNNSLPLEKEKFRAVQEDRISTVEECMVKEQALALKIKGLEQRRIKFMEEHGYGNMTLKEIAETLKGEEQMKMNALIEDVVLAVQNFNSYNDESMKMIRLKLHTLEKTAAAEGGQTYGRKGTTGDDEHMMSRLL